MSTSAPGKHGHAKVHLVCSTVRGKIIVHKHARSLHNRQNIFRLALTCSPTRGSRTSSPPPTASRFPSSPKGTCRLDTKQDVPNVLFAISIWRLFLYFCCLHRHNVCVRLLKQATRTNESISCFLLFRPCSTPPPTPQLLYVSHCGEFLALMDDNKEIRSDVRVPKGELGQRILREFRDGDKDVLVLKTVFFFA